LRTIYTVYGLSSYTRQPRPYVQKFRETFYEVLKTPMWPIMALQKLSLS